MKIRTGTSLVLLTLFAALCCARFSFAADAATGPTPYPANDKDWPGKGPVRKFGWMIQNRDYFWTQREKAQESIVFVGDSLTGNWKNLAKDFPKLKVANRGIGGDTSRGVLFRFKEDVLDLHPKAIVILCGTNDLTAMGKPADALSNVSDMLAMVQKATPDLPVVLCTTPPSAQPTAPVKASDRKAINEGLRKIAAERDHTYLCDLFAATAKEDGTPQVECFGKDQLHLALPGYAKWVELLTPIFDKLNLGTTK